MDNFLKKLGKIGPTRVWYKNNTMIVCLAIVYVLGLYLYIIYTLGLYPSRK